MVTYSQTRDFLPAGSELLVAIKPEGQLSEDLQQHIETNPAINRPQRCFIRMRLVEDLKIVFKLYDTGTIDKDLLPCQCEIPALPQEDIRSLNQAYQKISLAYERKRISAGGRVYDNFYHQTASNSWRLLENLRAEIYGPLKEEFEKRSNKIKGAKKGGVRPPDGNSLFIRKSHFELTLFNPVDIRDITANLPRFDEDGHLVCFGPLNDETSWQVTRLLQEGGLVYGTDFFTLHRSLPEWCSMMISAVDEKE